MPDLATIERLSYMHWDAVFLCFDVMNDSSLLGLVDWVSLMAATQMLTRTLLS